MKYDIIVIGGGPSGIMAAAVAGQNGARVFLVEKNHNLGAKLLITGKGRCNITNFTPKISELVKKYGNNGKFLFSAFNKFGPEEMVDFLKKYGVSIKIEKDNRVFPQSDKASDVLNALKNFLKDSGVEIKTKTQVKDIVKKGKVIEKIILSDGQELKADNFIIATGGKSYPSTGSSGDGYNWTKKLGHKIIIPRPALVPIIVKEKWIKELEGLSLKNVEISVYKNNKKIKSEFGEAIFTDNGLSGPIILNLSKLAGELLPENIKLKIDFKPELDEKNLDIILQKDFKEFSAKIFKNYLTKFCPSKLIPIMVKLSGISAEKKVGTISREGRKILLNLIKKFTLEVKTLGSFEKAIITTGGVDLREVDPQTMRSKIIENLYLVGEILDIDGPTGGYNLQVCWSTGYIAGSSFKKINN